ncbi:MAG: hypothetical protein ABL864_06590 [Terricaulis sp.]
MFLIKRTTVIVALSLLTIAASLAGSRVEESREQITAETADGRVKFFLDTEAIEIAYNTYCGHPTLRAECDALARYTIEVYMTRNGSGLSFLHESLRRGVAPTDVSQAFLCVTSDQGILCNPESEWDPPIVQRP